MRIDFSLLLLIPVGFAVGFMLWAFWNFCRASARPRRNSGGYGYRSTGRQ